MDIAKSAQENSTQETSIMITECPVQWEENQFCITCRFSADHAIAAKLAKKISRLLAKESVSGASISVSSAAQHSERGGAFQAK